MSSNSPTCQTEKRRTFVTRRTCLRRSSNRTKEYSHGCDEDKIKGTTNEAIGKAKQGIGEATGSDRLQGEGVIQE